MTTHPTIEWRPARNEDEAEEQEACECELAKRGLDATNAALAQRIERAGGRLRFAVTYLEVAQVGAAWFVFRMGCDSICSTRDAVIIERVPDARGSTVHASKRAANKTARANARDREWINGVPLKARAS